MTDLSFDIYRIIKKKSFKWTLVILAASFFGAAFFDYLVVKSHLPYDGLFLAIRSKLPLAVSKFVDPGFSIGSFMVRLSWFLPFLIAYLVSSDVHDDFSDGVYKYFLTTKNIKSYIIRKNINYFFIGFMLTFTLVVTQLTIITIFFPAFKGDLGSLYHNWIFMLRYKESYSSISAMYYLASKPYTGTALIVLYISLIVSMLATLTVNFSFLMRTKAKIISIVMPNLIFLVFTSTFFRTYSLTSFGDNLSFITLADILTIFGILLLTNILLVVFISGRKWDFL